MKVEIDAVYCVSQEALPKLITGELSAWDVTVYPKGCSSGGYVEIGEVPPIELNLSAEEIVQKGMKAIASKRAELTEKYHDAMEELRRRENDLRMIGFNGEINDNN